MSPNPVLQLKGVSYKFPAEKELVLDRISLSVSPGEFVVLVGPSGSGKTTLLLLARGFYKELGGNFDGSIFIGGKNIEEKSISELGNKIGIVFQDPALQLHQLRVIDEVMSAPMYQGLPFVECQKRAETLVDEMLGREFYDRSPNELSCGEQQKVALAAVLSMDCEIILLDEPFSFLDVKAAKEVLELLLKLKKQGKTIIISTHGVEHIAEYADRIVLLNEGKVVEEGKPDQVLYSKRLDEILTAPLSVKAAKLMQSKKKLKEKTLGWRQLISKIKMRPKNASKIKYVSEAMLQLQNVSFSYPEGKTGVNDVNLSVSKNEVLGIVGANGSGKTTLAKLVLGLLKPSNGKIILSGEEISGQDVSKRARRIGYVTQDPIDMFFETNVLAECAFGPKCFGLDHPEKLAEATLKSLSIYEYKDNHPDSLSGGEKSLLGMADILVSNPEILLLDEPEFGLDPKNWHKIVATIKRLQTQGKTTIVITQDLEKAMFLCDRVVLMKSGKILKEGTPKEVFRNEKLLAAAGLVSLPVFQLLKCVEEGDLSSEEKFVEAIAR